MLSELETYREASLRHFAALVMPDEPGPMSVLILGPTAASHPTSSLGCMFSWCAERHGHGETTATFTAEGGFELERAVETLRVAASDRRPLLVLAVSSALSAVLDALRARDITTRLPADSRIMYADDLVCTPHLGANTHEAQVNVAIAVLIWMMIYPMMIEVEMRRACSSPRSWKSASVRP